MRHQHKRRAAVRAAGRQHAGRARVRRAAGQHAGGRFIADSAGNYYRWRAHARGTLEPGQEQALSVVIDPADITLNEVEVWYDGADEFAVRIEPPGYAASGPVRLGERSDLRDRRPGRGPGVSPQA